MRIGLSLVAAPLTVLATQTFDYSLVHWACVNGTLWPLHWVSAGGFAFCVTVAALTLASARTPNTTDSGTRNAGEQRRRFLLLVGRSVALMAALVDVAIWYPQWILSPCP